MLSGICWLLAHQFFKRCSLWVAHGYRVTAAAKARFREKVSGGGAQCFPVEALGCGFLGVFPERCLRQKKRNIVANIQVPNVVGLRIQS